jgi:glycosyltransferase involved in cell wall biosynthesis
MKREQKIAIVMPCFNTEQTMMRTYQTVKENCHVDFVIVADDGSHDKTAQIGNELGCIVVSHTKNRGYGGAQKSGYTKALELGADIIVLVHGDNQYDPSLVGKFVEKIRDEYVPVVTGTRMVLGDALASGMPCWKFLANKFLTGLENLAFGTKLTDFHNGFRAYSADFLRSVPFETFSEKFDFDTDIILHAALRKVPIAEIPHTTRYREENSQMTFFKGVQYGTGILITVGRYYLHKFGVKNEPLFDVGNYRPHTH